MPRLQHLYLPRLADDAEGVGEPENAGAWEDNQRKILRSISNGIHVDRRARARGVSSVPDVWARPIMFQTALRPNSQHPLRHRMVQEWRGLLSLLALRRIQNYDVEIVPVSFGQGGTFVRALRKLGPDDVQLETDQTYEWTDVLMIRYEGVPVGAFSPTTLVYTSVDYQDKLRDLPLNLQQRGPDGHKTGYFAPPTHEEEKRYVGEWVYELKQRLGGLLNLDDEHPDHTVSLALNELLDDWLGDLRDDLGLGTRAEIDARDVAVADEPTRLEGSGSPLDKYAVYRELLRPLVIDDEARARASEHHSDLALDPSRNESDYDEVVVLTPRLLKQDVKIWKTKRLSHLGGDADAALARDFEAASGTLIDREDLSQFDACWIRPDRYFLTDALVKAPGNEPLLAEGERALNEGGRFLLPFKKEILDFFSPEDIQDRLGPEFEDTGDGVRFSFSLPITGGRTADVEKTYRRKDARTSEGRIVETPAPVLELFPNYLGENWRRYYLFQSGLSQVKATPVLHGEATTTTRDHAGEVDGGRQQVRLTEMHGDDAFPEGVELRGAGGDAWGLVLVGQPPANTQGLSSTWHVGVDFGTSNTNVFRRVDNNQAESWNFDFPRHLRPLSAPTPETRESILDAFFVPNRSVKLPIPTVLRIFDEARKEHPLLDYFIFFNKKSSFRLPESAKTNIKWDAEHERKTKYFLESLLFLILVKTTAKNVAKVKLACSYPKAFSEGDLAVFEGEWDETITKLVEDDDRLLTRRQGSGGSGVIIIDSAPNAKIEPDYEVEGVVSGQFFADPRTIPNPKNRASIRTAAVCLDVGGGTTDISLWHKGDIVLNASVMLAGRQVSKYLQRNAQLRELLFGQRAAQALEEVRMRGDKFAARLNVVLKQEGDNVRERLIEHANKKEVKALRQILTLKFGAITFYTASLLGAASRQPGRENLLEQVADSGVQLHWGGNAAKLITWVDFGKYDQSGLAAKMLNGIFFQALKDIETAPKPQLLGQLQSPGHKSEAAGGLVVMGSSSGNGTAQSGSGDDHPFGMSGATADSGASGVGGSEDVDFSMDDGASVTDGTVCGENIRTGGREIDHLESVTEKTFFQNDEALFEETTLERLERFLDVFNTFGTRFGLFPEERQIHLDERTKVHLADSVKGDFVKMRSQKAGSRSIEPVFVMEVKELLDLMISNQ